MKNKTFRLFVSSTFSDFIAERDALQRDVFPKLESYCAEQGAQFQALDLRWGITEEAQLEHDTMRICLEEVRRCQKLSPRPNFAVLLGDRYGWEPVPARIPKDHWKRLNKAASRADWVLIKANYQIDKNAIPHVYCLRKREQDQYALWRESQLLQALRRSAKGFPRNARLPYFASATHQEVALGALSKRDDMERALYPEQHVHVYVRHIDGIPPDESSKDFIDWDESTGEVVPGALKRLRGLERQLRRKLGDRVHDLHSTWRRHGQNGAVDKAYLKRFCDSFLIHQKALIDAELAILVENDEEQQREQAHKHFGAERARVFAGREILLARIDQYIAPRPKGNTSQILKGSPPVAPLFLLGGGGTGKSALIARAALEAIDYAKRSETIVLQRYIGGVPGTESLMSTLTALTADLASLYGQPKPLVPDNTKALAEGFRAALAQATEKRPLILFLDALDQFDKADNTWMLEWLPQKLPKHVRLVASVRTGTSVEQSARRRYPKSLIEVPAMKPAEGKAMLLKWLADKRVAWFNAGIAPTSVRRLTTQQQQVVLAAFNASGKGSALWLKLAYEEAATWSSWDAPRQLPPTVQGLIEDLIDHRLINQENHRKVFTKRALAYLTASRFGLSESELGRAMGTDNNVRAEFKANEKTQSKWKDEKLLPSILWSRLFFDLQPYLSLAQVDGALLIRWFHREFAEVLKARYLASDEDRQGIHGALAVTFLQLERELRPSEANDDGLFKATDVSNKQISAALRRVMEQPWQLAQSGKHEELQALITNFGFCMGKCAANRVDDLISDLIAIQSAGLPSLPWDRHLYAWRRRLRFGDLLWPAHRILIQLTGESADFGEPLRNEVYEPYVSSTYFSNQPTKIEELLLRRVTQLSDLSYGQSNEFLLYDDRWLLVINAKGIGTMIDLEHDLVVGIAPLENQDILDLEKAKIFSVEASSVVRAQKTGALNHKLDFEFETKFPGVLKIHGSELVIGNRTVEYLGSCGNDLIFFCEGQLLLINSDRLIEPGVAPGCFSVEGVRIEILKGMDWNYSRFGIVVFLNENTLLSLGWESSHIQRDEIKAEIWNLDSSGTSRRSEITLNDGLDFPLAALGILEDGRVIFSGDRFRRSYIIDPQRPDREFEHLWPVEWSWGDPSRPDRWWSSGTSLASKWRWPKRIKKELAKKSTNQFKGVGVDAALGERYWVRIGPGWHFGGSEKIEYQEHSLLHCAEFLNEGSYLFWGGMEEIDDSAGVTFLKLEDERGKLLRWFPDIPIVCAARISKHEIVIVKRSGPVTIRKGLRQ